jgi:hypothetical protein
MPHRSSSSPSSGPDWRALRLAVLVFVLSLPAVTLRIYASDEIQFFAYLRSLWFDQDVSFENEYRYFADSGVADNELFRETFLEKTSATGRRLNFGTIGSAILWAPFYGAADAWVITARAFGSTTPRDGYARPYIAAVCYGSAVYGLFALLLSGAVAAQLVGDRGATRLAVVAAWLGTPVVFYMYVAPVMAHATSAFAVAGFTWLWLRVRREWSPRGLALLGAAGALMTMVREQDAFIIIGPAVDAAWTVIEQRRWRAMAGAAAAALAFGVTFVPQALAYIALNGRIFPSQVTSRKMDWTAPHALDVLVSPEHGFFIWTPLAVLALAGLVLLAVRGGREAGPSASDTRRLTWLFLLITLGQVYVTGAVQSWTLAGAFGQRRFLALTVVLVTGLATMWTSARPRGARAVTALAVVLGLWWNIGLMVQFGAGLMDRQKLEPARNAYTTFVVVPARLPGIVYRYVFDRQSFYRAAPPAAVSDHR